MPAHTNPHRATYTAIIGVTLMLQTMGPAMSETLNDLKPEPDWAAQTGPDWLLDPSPYKAEAFRSADGDELVLSNGLIRRAFRLAPNGATVAFDNLITGESVIRGVKPEARVELDGMAFDVGGLLGQPNYAYLDPTWIDDLKPDPSGMAFVGFEVGEPDARLPWGRLRHHDPRAEWPPKGVHVRMDYRLPEVAALDLANKGPQESGLGRELLASDDFTTLDPAWSVHTSEAHERSSFENEGKVGEIYTPTNTAVFAERPLDPGTRLIEATIDMGSDESASWGPGLAVVFPDRTVKLYIRPAGNGYDTHPIISAWDGEREILNLGGRQRLDLTRPWSLRVRIDGPKLYLEAKPADGRWATFHAVELDEDWPAPTAVRLGKMDSRGGASDFKEAGGLGRCRVISFAAYTGLSDGGLAQLAAHTDALREVTVSVHYILYDGLPAYSKWLTVQNASDRSVTVNSFTCETLAAVEYLSRVEDRGEYFPPPNIHVETDYAFGGFDVSSSARHVVHWESDPDYHTQVSYVRTTPCLLEVRPEIGPEQDIPPGERFETCRAFVLPQDSYDRERQGLSVRRMYRTIAPWTTENPLMMHVRQADEASVKKAIDQCAETGFEMVIMTFGSGFNIEDNSPEYLARMTEYMEYARSKGVDLGGYSLLSSRRIGGGNDIVSPPGQHPTHGNCPALTSDWGQDYFQKLYDYYDITGQTVLEHDGSYPGDIDITPRPPYQKGELDSRWVQWRMIAEFYSWCRGRGVFLNIPDSYYLVGSNKCGMGYREVNWSLPRAQQVIHTRQNIFDGTWEKLTSMGWMFVPLTQYHGGGAAATVEPLSEHLDHYEKMLLSNLGAGVQACYRGPQLYDTAETKEMVTRCVDWFKTHREVLEGDLIHLRRPNSRDIDYWLMTNPFAEEKGLLMVFNPLSEDVTRTIRVPLYYTGLEGTATVSINDGAPAEIELTADRTATVQVTVPADGTAFCVFK